MSISLMKIVVLVVLLIVWKVFGKRITATLLVRSAATGALNYIGAKALASQPDSISLEREEFPQWTNAAAVDELKNPLVASGFEYAGTYKVDKMPGVKLAILVKPADCVAAHIYEHPKAGTWIELVTRYQDGSCHTLTTLPATGIQSPPCVQTIRTNKAPAADLVRQFLNGRHAGEMKHVGVEDAVGEFEQGYAKSMAWQKNKGMTTEEMAEVTQNWADKQSGKAAAASV
jgi:hypothetical protein